MSINKGILTVNLLVISSAYLIIPQEAKADGYYGSLNFIYTEQSAKNMDLSQRPGIGSFVAGEEDHDYLNGSVALGYDFDNNWRVEGEYVFKKNKEYTSGSSSFPTSLNHMQVESERVMLNAYRDFTLSENFSVYATAGLGLSLIEVSGWQGIESRTFSNNNQTNLTYSLGAGAAYRINPVLSVYAGYRYVDMGSIESGRNTFMNARSLQDENMRAHLINQEYQIGLRYSF